MEPALHVGSIVIIAPQTNYKVGDVITFGEIGNAKTPTTHRIKDVKIVDGNAVYLTQGDANESADSHEVAQSEVVGKVLFSIPFIGYALNFVKQPLGFGLVIIIPAVLIIWEEMKKINRELAKNRKKSNNSLK
jgi:signal peptidase